MRRGEGNRDDTTTAQKILYVYDSHLGFLDVVIDFALRLAEANDGPSVSPPPWMSPELVADVRRILKSVREAQGNRGDLSDA